MEPILGSWEANIGHALARSPIDVCTSRSEDPVVLGNMGVVRVLKVHAGSGTVQIREGDLCLVMPFGRLDQALATPNSCTPTTAPAPSGCWPSGRR